MRRFLALACWIGSVLAGCAPGPEEEPVAALVARPAPRVTPARWSEEATLAGRVELEDGAAPGEPVTVVAVAVLEPEGRERTVRVAVAADGRFTLPVAAGTWSVRLALEAETLVAREACVLAPGAREARLVAERRALLSGSVRLGAGQRLLPSESLADGQLGWRAPALRVTAPGTRRVSYQGERGFALLAADGTFVLPQLPAGLELELELDAPFGDLLARVAPLAPGERRAVELVLTRGARDGQPWRRVTGQVLDEQGAPAEDAEVWLRPALPGRGGRASPRALCAADGRFALDGVVVEALELVAGGEHYAHDGLFALEPGTEDREGLVLRVGRGVELGGEVLWPDGSAAGSALVSFGAREVRAEEGRFRLRGLLPAADLLRIEASRPGALGRFAQEVVPGSTPARFVLVETPLHDVRVRVTDGRGAPVEVSVSAWYTGADGEADRAVVRREPDATFRLSLPAGHLRLELAAERFHDRVLELELPSKELVEVTLEAARELSGRVLDPAGAPIEGARVRSLAVPSAPGATTDAEGRFRLLSAARPERLVASHEAHAPSAPLELALDGPSAEGLELRLRAPCTLEGRVRGTVDEDTLLELDSAGGPRTSRLAPDGSFRLQGLAPGPCEVRVVRAGVEGPRVTVELGADAPTTVELDAP